MPKEFIISRRYAGVYQLQLKPEAGCPSQIIEDFDTHSHGDFMRYVFEANQRTLPPVWRIVNVITGEISYGSCPACKDSDEYLCDQCPKWQKELPAPAVLTFPINETN